MGYRTIEKEKPIRRVLQDTTTRNRTFIQNGAIANLAIPCWYHLVRHPQHTHVHDREWHDHIGWPNPGSTDKSSQDAYLLKDAPYHYDEDKEGWNHAGRYLDLSQFYPIHLEEEGYTDVEIAFANPPEGLSAYGLIDDYIVRFVISTRCNAAITEDIDVPYTVFIKGEVKTKNEPRSTRDIVAKGILHILAGPYE